MSSDCNIAKVEYNPEVETTEQGKGGMAQIIQGGVVEWCEGIPYITSVEINRSADAGGFAPLGIGLNPRAIAGNITKTLLLCEAMPLSEFVQRTWRHGMWADQGMDWLYRELGVDSHHYQDLQTALKQSCPTR